MYLNQFSVRIPEGTETSGGYVQIRHGQQYRLTLNNSRSVRCDAEVTIDGKHVGTWRLNPHQSATLERGVNDTGKFTAYVAGTSDAQKAEIDPSADATGLITVVFTPEKYAAPAAAAVAAASNYTPDYWYANNSQSMGGGLTAKGSTPRGIDLRSASPVGTGLSGQSNQTFDYAGPIEYDYEQQTTINLRLMSIEPAYNPPPLPLRENPVPPPVGPRPLR